MKTFHQYALGFTTIVATLALSFLTVSCGPKKQIDQLGTLNASWEVIGFSGEEKLPNNAQGMQVTFDVAAATVGGYGMCNSFGSSLRATKDGRMQTGEFTSTRVACSGTMYENMIMGALSKARYYVIDGNRLYLYPDQSKETPVLVLKPLAK